MLSGPSAPSLRSEQLVGITASHERVFGWRDPRERSAVLFFNTLFLYSSCPFLLAHDSRPASTGTALDSPAQSAQSSVSNNGSSGHWAYFFATSPLTHLEPKQFFGIAFWIGFSINTLVVELWLRSKGASTPNRKVGTPSGVVSRCLPVACHDYAKDSPLIIVVGCIHLGLLAILYTVLFNAGAHFRDRNGLLNPIGPGHGEPASVIVPYFQTHCEAGSDLSFPAIWSDHLPWDVGRGIVSQLRICCCFRLAGFVDCAWGGFLTVFDGVAASLIVWTMINSGCVAQNPPVLLGLYYLSYAFGGPGFSIPKCLNMIGVPVPAAFMRLLPKWIVVLGLVLVPGCRRKWSRVHLISPAMLFLIPLTRFPGFIWLIAAGFALPRTLSSSVSGGCCLMKMYLGAIGPPFSTMGTTAPAFFFLKKGNQRLQQKRLESIFAV